jgi:hypothetical protein
MGKIQVKTAAQGKSNSLGPQGILITIIPTASTVLYEVVQDFVKSLKKLKQGRDVLPTVSSS